VLIPSLDEKVIRTRSYGSFQSRGGISRLAAVNRVATRAADQMTLCSSPTTRSAKKQAHQSSPGTLAGASPLLPSAPSSAPGLRPMLKSFRHPRLPSSNVPRSKNRNEAYAQSARKGVSSRALGESPRTTIFRDRTFSNEPP